MAVNSRTARALGRRPSVSTSSSVAGSSPLLNYRRPGRVGAHAPSDRLPPRRDQSACVFRSRCWGSANAGPPEPDNRSTTGPFGTPSTFARPVRGVGRRVVEPSLADTRASVHIVGAQHAARSRPTPLDERRDERHAYRSARDLLGGKRARVYPGQGRSSGAEPSSPRSVISTEHVENLSACRVSLGAPLTW